MESKLLSSQYSLQPQVEISDFNEFSNESIIARPTRGISPTQITSTCIEPNLELMITAIQLGHTHCLRTLLEGTDYQSRVSRHRSVSPGARINRLIDVHTVPTQNLISVKRKLIILTHQRLNILPSYVYEFEQTSNPLIWAVDCQEWGCLQLLCSFRNSSGPERSKGLQNSNFCAYNPSQPQTVIRRIVTSNNRFIPEITNCICCVLQKECHSQLSLSNCYSNHLSSKLKPFASLMLNVAFSDSSLAEPNSKYRSKSAQNSPQRCFSPDSQMSADLIIHSNNSKVYKQHTPDSIFLICSEGQPTLNLIASSRHLKRPTPYRTYWMRGTYSYQSLIDYFIAVGYEIVGTNLQSKNKLQNFENCSHCLYASEYPNCPNFPVGPWDIRNERFWKHFSQLDAMLTTSGVSANRLDAVIAFNALATSASRRLLGWSCHGNKGDCTIMNIQRNSKHIVEPLIEWRILGTLLDHGLNEFEWLEFMSPQHNLIGQAICVLAWPIWSDTEITNSNAFNVPKVTRDIPLNSKGRIRRRSSSPITNYYPSTNLSNALKKQACLLLVNLWAIGAFSSHHIVQLNNTRSRIWNHVSNRSHSYTAAMDGGDLRRIMLKTITYLPGAIQLDPLGLLRRWSYFNDLWRSTLSGTPLPEPPTETGNILFTASKHSPQLHRRKSCLSKPDQQISFNSHSSFSDIRNYQPVCLRLQARRAIRKCLVNAQNACHGLNGGQGFRAQIAQTPLSPALQQFIGFFHSFEQIKNIDMPLGLRTIISTVIAEDPANYQ